MLTKIITILIPKQDYFHILTKEMPLCLFLTTGKVNVAVLNKAES